MSLENFPRKGRRAPGNCCSGRSAATAGGLKGVELLELVKWPTTDVMQCQGAIFQVRWPDI